MSETVFEKIAKGELPSYKVWEDDKFMAFLSIGPFAKGHTLVIPKENWGDYIFDLENERYQELMMASKKVAQNMKEKLDCDRILVWLEGYEVPHVHVHLIPSKKGYGLRSLEPVDLSPEEFEEIREKIAF